MYKQQPEVDGKLVWECLLPDAHMYALINSQIDGQTCWNHNASSPIYWTEKHKNKITRHSTIKTEIILRAQNNLFIKYQTK